VQRLLSWKSNKSSASSSSSSPSSSYHGVGPLVDPFRSHTTPCLFYGLPFFFCLLVCISFLFSVIYYEEFCLYVAISFFCILSKSGAIFFLLQSFFFNNQSQCILLFFSYISYLLPLFFLRLLL